MIKRRYWLFQRGTVFYFEDSHTRQQKSLRTRNRKDAERMLLAMNEAAEHPQLNLSLARAYLANHDREYADRKWSVVMERFADRPHPATRRRSQTAMRSRPFDLIRDKRLIETTSEDFLAVIKAGGNSTQTHLKALHNFALGMGWLPWEILPKKLWPPVRKKPRRAITWEEHQRIVEGEHDRERKLYCELLWEVGASQTDAANLTTDNIDWRSRTLVYLRRKLEGRGHARACLTIGPRLEALLNRLPQSGFLFPKLQTLNDKHRATFFYKLTRKLGIKGITLHSYRYAWAQRAKAAGYPERWAQAALGHNSRAVHDAYAAGAEVTCPSLETFEDKIIALPSNDVADETSSAEA